MVPCKAFDSANVFASQIFKSTALIGGTKVINMWIGIVRTKALIGAARVVYVWRNRPSRGR